jgi:hypothetical protein
VNASPTSFQAGGGSGSATITTAATCTWTARSDSGWLSITSGGSGDTSTRACTLTVADQSVPIRQDAAAVDCTYSIAPTSASTGKDAGTGAFDVTATATCPWTAESSAPWLTVTSGQGSGNGTVAYSISRNLETAKRTATIRVAGQTFTLTQFGDTGGCQYTVAPIQFSPCMGSIELSSQITTQAECPWTAAPGVSWITLQSSSSSSGSGTVRFKVSDNFDAPRSGVVMLRWPTPTEGQNLQIAQAGCYYAVSRDSVSFAAGGGTGTFDVITYSDPNTCGSATQDRCVWTAQSDVAWITITSGMPRAGDNPVSFTVAPNDSPVARSGNITVRDKTVHITQSGR